MIAGQHARIAVWSKAPMAVDATLLWVALGLSTLLAMVAVAMSGTEDDGDGYRRT